MFEYVTVRNIPNTSDSKAPNGKKSWKEYWEDATERKFDKCSVKGCHNDAEHGAHVKGGKAKSYSEDLELTRIFGNSHCIVPLCAEHNNSNNTDDFIVHAVDLVKIVE